ncbi:hypothetical protein HYS00_02565 [Candidatus Microgenomates bacterium]|nr:hypothetical protein [Candidatus Microgenomates bacterium]
MKSENSTFAELFKKYRLRSEIETLSQFGDLLAQEGLVYENSLFTHWQKGDRVPKDRKVLLVIITIFIKRGSVRTAEEANELLDSVGQRALRTNEIEDLRFHNPDRTALKDSPTVFTNERSLGQMLRYTALSIIITRPAQVVLALFLVQSIWFYRIQAFHLYDTNEAYWFNWSYGFIALLGALYGLFHPKSKKSPYYQAIRLLSFGMLCEWFGVQVWFYYNLTGINVPYPSIADLGYFSIIPVYTLAAMKIANTTNSIAFTLNKKIILLLTPVLLLTLGYSTMLAATGLNLSRQVRFFLSFTQPTGEIIPVSILVYLLLYCRTKLNQATRLYISILTVCMGLQLFTDFTFMFSAQTNQYLNAGINDYLYVITYSAMSLTIISFVNNSQAIVRRAVKVTKVVDATSTLLYSRFSLKHL